jgi:hypothetical protein
MIPDEDTWVWLLFVPETETSIDLIEERLRRFQRDSFPDLQFGTCWHARPTEPPRVTFEGQQRLPYHKWVHRGLCNSFTQHIASAHRRSLLTAHVKRRYADHVLTAVRLTRASMSVGILVRTDIAEINFHPPT